jgi:GTP cyclohydrolase II
MPLDPAPPDVGERLRLRLINRAASELRRGVPVVLRSDEPLLLLAAETASPAALKELEALTGAPPMLLLAPARAAAILRAPMPLDAEAAAVTVAGSAAEIEVYQRLADPTSAQPLVRHLLSAVAAPSGAAAALRLAKIGRLLPAVLAGYATDDVAAVSEVHDLIQVSAADVLRYTDHETAGLRRVASALVPLSGAPDSRVVAFRTDGSAIEHLAIVIGHPEHSDAPLVRIHSECFTGDLLGSMRCDCGEQLRGAIHRIAEDGAGVLLYLAQEGRGIGLVNKLRAYGLQDRGLDTMDANRALGWGADERDFMVGATMLQTMGIKRVRLLTNNPEKVAALATCGIEVVGREPHSFEPNGINDEYLATKAARFGHMLD